MARKVQVVFWRETLEAVAACLRSPEIRRQLAVTLLELGGPGLADEAVDILQHGLHPSERHAAGRQHASEGLVSEPPDRSPHLDRLRVGSEGLDPGSLGQQIPRTGEHKVAKEGAVVEGTLHA